MNLDDLDRIKKLDSMEMLAHIQGLPEQLEGLIILAWNCRCRK